MKTKLILGLLFLSIFIFACQPAQRSTPIISAPVQEPMAPAAPVQPEVKASVSIISVPASVNEGDEFAITWKVDSDQQVTIPHTAVHYGTTSIPGELSVTTSPQTAGYPSFTPDFAAKTSPIPGTFTAKIKAPTGAAMLYFRAHAIINGNNIWTPEQSIRIFKAAAPAPTTQSYAINAQDSGASPSSLSIPKGTKYTITFNVASSGVYYGGLSFTSNAFTGPGKVAPGASWTTPVLTADQTFMISAYWPASGVHKWDLTVNVS